MPWFLTNCCLKFCRHESDQNIFTTERSSIYLTNWTKCISTIVQLEPIIFWSRNNITASSPVTEEGHILKMRLLHEQCLHQHPGRYYEQYNFALFFHQWRQLLLSVLLISWELFLFADAVHARIKIRISCSLCVPSSVSCIFDCKELNEAIKNTNDVREILHPIYAFSLHFIWFWICCAVMITE